MYYNECYIYIYMIEIVLRMCSQRAKYSMFDVEKRHVKCWKMGTCDVTHLRKISWNKSLVDVQFQWFTTAKTLESHNAFANPWQAECEAQAEEVKKDTAAGRCFIQPRWPVEVFPAIAQDLLCLHLQEWYSSLSAQWESHLEVWYGKE